jgi:hypothetical protein
LSEDQNPITLKTIQEMAKLTVFSGRLNELQERNLKTYPFVYFNGVSAAKLDYDLTRIPTEELGKETNSSRISYHLSINDMTPNDNLDRRFQALVSSVRTLLWADMKVFVYFNNVKVFETKDE